MSTKICLIRHGESQANQRDVFLGHYDLDLTDTGRAQAAMAADFLKDSGASAIYSSDLTRAYETARRTAELLGLPIVKDPDLREVDAGLWDNMPFAELAQKFPESFGRWVRDIGNAGCDGGETVEQLKNRVLAAVERIAKAHDGQTVLIFTHGTPLRAVAAHCMGKTRDEMVTVPWAANTSVTTVIYDNGEMRLEQYSRDDFMGDLVTRLPDNV